MSAANSKLVSKCKGEVDYPNHTAVNEAIKTST